jgi:spermidine synthase
MQQWPPKAVGDSEYSAGASVPAPERNRIVKRPAFAILLLVVSVAGAASLLYEVLWVRALGLSLGSTAVATSVMLSAFLGGLSLGSWSAARRSDALESPLKALFWLEVVAAVLGVLSIPGLVAAGRAYVVIATHFGATPAVSLILRALFALLVMLIPATVFGATFPLATAAAARLTDLEDAAGGVSAASAFGSAVGAAVTGLLLEPAIGLAGSSAVGATVNLTAALLAVAAMRVGPFAAPAKGAAHGGSRPTARQRKKG